MNNIKNKISQNKILTFIVVAFVLALSLYGCKTFIANAANNQEEKSNENQGQVDVNNEQTTNDEAPLEAYGYKDTTSEPGQTILVLTYDKDKHMHWRWGEQTVYNIPKVGVGESSWEWNSDRSSFTKVKINENFKNYNDFDQTSYMFSNFTNVSSVEGFEYINTSNVREMIYMFNNFGCYSTSLNAVPDVSKWDTSNVSRVPAVFTDKFGMYGMFWGYGYRSTQLNVVPDVSNWNVSKVYSMESMFQDYGYSSTVLNAVPDVSNWNMSSVHTMESMFRNYGYNSLVLDKTVNVANWSPTSAEDISHMFQDYSHSTTKLKAVPNFSKWPQRNYVEIQYMLCGYAHLCVFDNLDLSSFIRPRDWFWHSKNTLLNCHLRSITLSPEWHTSMLPQYCCLTNSKDQVGATWYDSEGRQYIDSVIPPRERTTTYYDSPVEGYAYKDSTEQGEIIFRLSYDNKKDWHDVSYSLSTSANQASDWEWDKARCEFTKVNIDESFKNYGGFTSTAYMFSNFRNVSSSKGFEYLDTSHVKNMSYMFYRYGWRPQSQIDVPEVSLWNTIMVKDMSYMFYQYGYESKVLDSVPNVSNWNTLNVENMSYMFADYGIHSTHLKSLPDVSHWYTYNVTDVSYMFYRYGFYNTFENLDLSRFQFKNGSETRVWSMLRSLKLKSITLNYFFREDFDIKGHWSAWLTNSLGKCSSAIWYDENGNEYNGTKLHTMQEGVMTFYDHNPKATNSITMSKHMITQQDTIDNAISQHSQNSSLIHHITHHVSKVADVVKKVFH